MKNNQMNKYFIVITYIIALLVIIVISSNSFRLVLLNSYDNKNQINLVKTYLASEGALELALLKLKEKGCAYNIENEKFLNLSNLSNKNENLSVLYSINSKTKEYSGKILPLKYEIIPLFYTDKNRDYKIKDLSLISSQNSIYWNIISTNGNITGTGVFLNDTIGETKMLIEKQVYFNKETIKNFLINHNKSYLVLFNPENQDFKYKLKSDDFFSKPNIEVTILSQIGNSKRNLKVKLNNISYFSPLN